MGKAIDDALGGGCGLTGGADLEPFEGERRAGTVAQKTFEPRSVPRRDSYRGIDAETATTLSYPFGRINSWNGG